MRLSRRTWLRLSALGVVGTAGCASDPRFSDPVTPDDGAGVPKDETPARDTPASTDSPTDEPTPSEHPLPEPEDRCSADAAIDDEDPLTVQFDARERFRCRGTPLDTFESLDHWSTHSGSVAANTADAFTGSQSARLEATPDDKRVRIDRFFPGGVDLSGQDLSLAVKLDAPTAQSVGVHLAAPDNENILFMGRYIWRSGWVRIDLGPLRERGAPDLSTVTRISIQVYTGGGERTRLSVDSLRRKPRSGPGRAVLTFDHSLASHYDVVFPLMQRYGHAGNVSVIPGSTRWSRKLSLSDLREMQAAGWDVVASPRKGENFRALASAEQASRIREAKQWLVTNGFERGADFMVWPAGRYDRTSLRAASRYHHLGFAGGKAPFGMVSDPLLVGQLLGERADAVERAIDLAAKYDQVLPVAYNAVGNMMTGMSKERFERTLAHIDRRGLEVVTASELWSSLE